MGVTLRKYVSCLCLSVLFYIRVWADFVDLARVRVYIFIYYENTFEGCLLTTNLDCPEVGDRTFKSN